MTQHDAPRTSWAMTAVSRRHVDQGRLSSSLCCCWPLPHRSADSSAAHCRFRLEPSPVVHLTWTDTC